MTRLTDLNAAAAPTTDREVRFDPPGPGSWRALADHFPGALTPEYQLIYAETAPVGMATYMARYGVLARSIAVGFVHGHLYIAPLPLAGPAGAGKAPPAALVWLLSRLHPEIRRRTRAARQALDDRPWRHAARQWFDHERDTWRQRNETVQAAEPTGMDSRALASHLRVCRALVTDGYRRHFELHGDDLLPIGLLLVRCSEWGIAPARALRALDGASLDSPAWADADFATPAPWQLVTSYDLDGQTWVELAAPPPARRARSVEPVDLSAEVPAKHRRQSATLVADARAAVPLRDDNGALTGAWPMGLLRRAMLAAGQRLGLSPSTLAVEMTVEEIIARLHGASDPSEQQLLERGARRFANSQLDAPPKLGPELVLPDLASLPRPLALIGAAQLAVGDHMESPIDPSRHQPAGRGVGVGTRPHAGRVLVVEDPSTAMVLIEPGDVVVSRFTSPLWNAVLAQAGALVTTTGGLVSHAAVIARELDIPAVVGDAEAMTRLQTGMFVSVDPVASTVTELGPD